MSDFSSQNLASILNNPHDSSANVNAWSWGFSTAFGTPSDVSGGSEVPPTSLQPLVPVVKLPEVILSDFERYLRLVRDRYPRFIAARDAAAKDAAERQGKQEALRRGGTGRAGGLKMMGEGLVAALREVPSTFFQEDFTLAHSQALKDMTPSNDNEESSRPQTLTMMLQEQLSNYLDRVEVHLLKEISARSESFFQALAVLQDLSGLIHTVCGKIVGLRQIVLALDQQLMESAVRMQQLHWRRSNLMALYEKVKVVEGVAQAQADLALLTQAQDFAAALDVVDDIRRVMASGELAGVHCFRHLEEHVEVAAVECDRMMTLDFLRIARRDAATHPQDQEGEEEENEEAEVKDSLSSLALGLLRTSRLTVVVREYGENLVEDIKDTVKCVLGSGLAALIEECGLEGGVARAEESGGGGSLTARLQLLPCPALLTLLGLIQEAVRPHLTRAGTVWSVVQLAVEQYSATPASSLPPLVDSSQMHFLPSASTLSPSSAQTQALSQVESAAARDRVCREALRNITQAVTQAVEAAQARWAKLLGVRGAIHARLRLEDFSAVMAATEQFMLHSEATLQGQKCRGLRSTIHTQAKAFLDNMHHQSISKMASLLESEPWQSADVDIYFQCMVDWVRSVGELAEEREDQTRNTSTLDFSSTYPPPSLNGSHTANGSTGAKAVKRVSTENVRPAYPPGDFREAMPGLPSRGVIASGSGLASSTSEVVKIEQDNFHMVNSGLMLLNMIVEYIDLARRIPLLSTEVVHRVAELLKLFNSRTCQLVLGAGAMQVSGLKSITAKHLALANQSLTLILALLPSIKLVLGAMLPEQRHLLLLCELDRIGQDYRLHRDEIHSKLIAIMQERLQFQRRKIPQMMGSWVKEQQVKEVEPSEFARSLVKEIAVLRRVLSPLLLESELLVIFGQVGSNFNSALLAAFQKIDYKDNVVVQRHLFSDGMHIAACLQTLPQKEGEEGPGVLQQWLYAEFSDFVT